MAPCIMKSSGRAASVQGVLITEPAWHIYAGKTPMHTLLVAVCCLAPVTPVVIPSVMLTADCECQAQASKQTIACVASSKLMGSWRGSLAHLLYSCTRCAVKMSDSSKSLPTFGIVVSVRLCQAVWSLDGSQWLPSLPFG